MSALHPALLLLFTFVAVFLQCRIEILRDIIGVQIDLLPPIMVYTALSTNFATVAIVAFAGGLLVDSLSVNPLGVSIFPLLLTGVALLWFRDLLLRDQRYARNMLGMFASVAVPAMTLLLLLSLGKGPLLGWGTIYLFIVLGATGAVLTPIVFSLFDQLQGMFMYKVADRQTSFRDDREIKRNRR